MIQANFMNIDIQEVNIIYESDNIFDHKAKLNEINMDGIMNWQIV